jgi:DNA-directed RNA polymerase specialized sigma24 family protein
VTRTTGQGGDDPSAQKLVALARERLGKELRTLPPVGSPEYWERLTILSPRPEVSRGALVWAVREAAARGALGEARELFMVLLQRIDGLNGAWIRRCLAIAAARGFIGDSRDHANDLMHDLTLILWEHIVWGDDEPWQLFFSRALSYAQSHVAESWNARLRRSAATPLSGLNRALGRLDWDGDEDALVAFADIVRPDDSLTAADLADLRAYVARLPRQERTAVILRFWEDAEEEKIAAALGGVTTRTVRNILRRAYKLLLAWYTSSSIVEPQGAGGGKALAGYPSGEGETHGE